MIDSLPDEVLETILIQLDLVQLVRDCKLVCKKWLQVVNSMRFDELIVTRHFLYESYWHHSYRPVNIKNVIQFARNDFWSYPAFRCHFARLKFLKHFAYFGTSEISEIFFEHLSEFERLEHLEFGGLLQPKNNHLLRLPALKVLKIRVSSFLFEQSNQLIIDAGRLEVLHCYCLKFVRLLSPSSLRTLEVFFLGNNLDLQQFENLEILKVIGLESHDLYIFNVSENAPRLPASLKQIYVNDECIKDLDASTRRNKDAQLTYRKSFKIWKRIIKLSFKGEAPEFYFLNVRVALDRWPQFGDYDFRPEELEFYHRNYDALAKTFPFFNRIDYDELINLYNGRLPNDLFRRFNNIQRVTAKRIESPQHLICFLANCPLLTELDLHCPNFGSECYDRLPSLCSRLTHFYLAEQITRLINYDFVLNFQALTLFSTSQNLPGQLALQAVNRLRFLQDFTYSDPHGIVRISKIDGQFAFAYKKYKFDGSRWRSRQIIDYTGLSYAELGQLCLNYPLIQSM